MPKTNDQTGATYAGNQGIVEHGAPIEGGRILSELDPELNLDGTLIEGEHPDHDDEQPREYVATSDPSPIVSSDDVEESEEGSEEKQNPDRTAAPVVGKGATRDDSADVATPNTVKPAGARGSANVKK